MAIRQPTFDYDSHPEYRGLSASEKRKKRYATDPKYREFVQRRNRERNKINPLYSDLRLGSRMRVHGKTAEWFTNQNESQNGLCAICQRPPDTARLYVDHDHSCCEGHNSCGRCVRALLCNACNRMLGHAKDNITILIRAISYLRTFGPATTKREDPVMGCDSLNSCESMREKSEAVSPLVN